MIYKIVTLTEKYIVYIIIHVKKYDCGNVYIEKKII